MNNSFYRKNSSLLVYTSFLSLTLFLLFANVASARNLSANKQVKKEYPEVYNGIKEFALRLSVYDKKKQKEQIKLQCKAFLAIAEVLQNNPSEKELEKIKNSLSRWSWPVGEPILSNSKPIDWHMAWMEAIYQK